MRTGATVLETERLILRELTMDDLEAIAEMYADQEVRRFFPEGTLTREETREELEWFIHVHYVRYGFGLWATVLKETGALIGRCGLLPWTIVPTVTPGITALEPSDETPPEADHLEVEVAYLLARPYWGKGLATEAALAIVAHAFERLQLSRLICLFEPENLASANVARKIGMTYEKQVELDGEALPLHSMTGRSVGRTA
ncbi:MAG: GNAT family N-acetyltransferase [Actinomycetota bacterium]